MSEFPVAAVQTALAAEHAAVWGYGLVSAFLPSKYNRLLDEAATGHRARRDATERLLQDAGAAPVPAQPGYLTPQPVTDAASALRLVVTLEDDSAAAWRSVVERSAAEVPAGTTNSGEAPGPPVRPAALDALVTAAVRAARWRAAAGDERLTVPFPGLP